VQEKLNKITPERISLGSIIRTCGEDCAVFLKCPQFGQSKGHLCKVVTDYQKDFAEKISKLPDLSPQQLVVAEFAINNLIKIKEIENIIVLEGFIHKDKHGLLTPHSLFDPLLKLQISVAKFLGDTKNQDEEKGEKGVKDIKKALTYAQMLQSPEQPPEQEDNEAKK
jgi:hypothetical protein